MRDRPTIPGFIALFLATAAPLLAGRTAHASDPTTADCLTASENSVTLRGKNALRAARSELLVCAASTCPTDIRTECARRVDAVNAAIPTIVFEVKDAAGNDVSAVKVSMDGQPLLNRVEGSAVSLDPGEHRFTFEVAGQAPVEKMLVLHEGEKDRRERIDLAPASTPQPHASGNGQRVLGLFAGGVGIVGVGLGAVFAASASSSWSKSKADCASPTDCANHDQAVSEHDSAVSAAAISTIGFIAGGALIATGAILFFTAPSRGKAAEKSAGLTVVPSVGAGGGGMLLRGSF